MAQSAAQQSLEALEKIREHYGVSFNKNMDLEAMAAQWIRAVAANPQVVAANPTVATIMTAAAIVINANEAVVIANEVQVKIVVATKLAQDAVGAANPITSAQFTPIITQEALAIGTQAAMSIKNIALQEATTQAVTLIANIP